MTCCKKCYYRNKNSKYTNENCVFFDQSVEILDWVQLCLRRCFEDVASAQQGEGEAGGGEVAGPGVVGGREAVEVGIDSRHLDHLHLVQY